MLIFAINMSNFVILHFQMCTCDKMNNIYEYTNKEEEINEETVNNFKRKNESDARVECNGNGNACIYS